MATSITNPKDINATVPKVLDPLTLININLLHPNLRYEALSIYKLCEEALTGRARVRFTHTLRSIKVQDALYAKGRDAKGQVISGATIVTKAKGGQSYHNYGLAIDFCLIVDGKVASYYMTKDYDGDKKSDWKEVVQIFKNYNWFWGGDYIGKFKDYDHFEKRLGHSLKYLEEKYRKGQVDAFDYVRL